MFTPTLRCECAQPGLIDTMRKWSIWLIRERFVMQDMHMLDRRKVGDAGDFICLMGEVCGMRKILYA